MPINIDALLLLKSDYDVVIKIDCFGWILIDFAKPPSEEILRDLKELTRIPGVVFRSYACSGLDFVVSLPRTQTQQNKLTSAETIAQCLIKDHGLTVERYVHDRSLRGITPSADRKVECFLENK